MCINMEKQAGSLSLKKWTYNKSNFPCVWENKKYTAKYSFVQGLETSQEFMSTCTPEK